ncbi:MAG: hypothetical protein QXO17_07885 [Nitrososphaerota archaeon]
MEVWVPWRDTELLLELPGEALVDLMDPPEPDPSSVRNDPLTDRNFPVALLDVTFASTGSIGTLVRRCPAEETYVISWADLESPSSGTELRRAAEVEGALPVTDVNGLSALRERVARSGELLLVAPSVASLVHALDDRSLAESVCVTLGIGPEEVRVEVLRYLVDQRGEFTGFTGQGPQVQEPERGYDLVVCSPGGRPFDRTLVGSLLVALAASRLSADGRVLGVVCGCEEGFGSRLALDGMIRGSGEGINGVYALLASRFVEERSRVRILTNAPLPRAVVQELLGIRQASRVDDLVHAATRFVGREIRVAVLRRAALGFRLPSQ